MTPSRVIYEINQVARRRFHRLPIEARRAVVGSLEGLDRIGPRDVEAALAEARRRKGVGEEEQWTGLAVNVIRRKLKRFFL